MASRKADQPTEHFRGRRKGLSNAGPAKVTIGRLSVVIARRGLAGSMPAYFWMTCCEVALNVNPGVGMNGAMNLKLQETTTCTMQPGFGVPAVQATPALGLLPGQVVF